MCRFLQLPMLLTAWALGYGGRGRGLLERQWGFDGGEIVSRCQGPEVRLEG